MAEPFLSEIRIFSFSYAPQGWALCNGQFLPIAQNQALFSLLGTTYGGNGQTTFALPNLRGRLPIHEGDGQTLGEAAGTSAVTVNIGQLPTHVHLVNASSTDGNTSTPTNGILAREVGNVYRPPTAGLIAQNPEIISSVGGNQPHTNMMPYLVLNFCIALTGIFPSQN
jgi:microcystin-dependent protein